MKLQSHSQWSDDILDIFRDDQLCYRAMKLFYATGHTIYRKPQTLDRDIRNFVYIDIRHKHVFTGDELSILDCVESASFLFTNGAEYFRNTNVDQAIDYFAVSLNISDIYRSQIAHEIHYIFSLFSPSVLSIILFEDNKRYMFSLADRRNEQRSIVVLSDWYSVQEMVDNFLLDALDVAYLPDKNAIEFFRDIVYNIARAPSVSSDKEYFTRKNRKTNVTPVLKTDDVELASFELELGTTNNGVGGDSVVVGDSDDDEHDFEEDKDIYSSIDDELLNDPIKLLEWIKDSEVL
jgi:hypothetical protein